MAVPVPPDVPGGFVFCIRVGDHPTPQFRYVAPARSTDPLVVDDTYKASFDAWALAREDVVRRWNRLADPANLAPVVPLAMRRAAETVREHAAGMDIEQIDRTVEALEAPYAERILRLFRSGLAIEDDAERATTIVGLVEELGLEPPPPPEPLPEINPDDVYLVCWLALVPQQPDAF